MDYRPLTTRDRRLLAATVHYEAASEPELGKAAVAQVVLNRAQDGRRGWRGRGAGPIERVVFKRKQFSCWNEQRSQKLAKLFVGGDPDRGWVSDTAARGSRDAVRKFLQGRVDTSSVEACSHYINPDFAAAVGNALNTWARGLGNGVKIGRHVFLRPDQLTPSERDVEPVRIRFAPALEGDEAPYLVKKFMRFGRRAYSFVAAILTALALKAEAVTSWLWSFDIAPERALNWVSGFSLGVDPFPLIAALMFGAVAIYFLLQPEKPDGQTTGNDTGSGGWSDDRPYRSERIDDPIPAVSHGNSDRGQGDELRSAGWRESPFA